MATENAKPFWRYEWQAAFLSGLYEKDDKLGQDIFTSWQRWPLPDDVFPPDESIAQEFPRDDWWWLHDPIEDEIYWAQSPQADSVENFLLGATSIPDDIELFDEIPLEETEARAPLVDDVVDQSGQTTTSIPDDIELFDEVPIEETWTASPLADDAAEGVGAEVSAFLDTEPEDEPDGFIDTPRPDDVVDQSGQAITSIPEDIELFDTPPEETWLDSPRADDVVDQSGQTITSIPEDIELFDDVPLEETLTVAPLAEGVEDPLLGVESIPDDIELFDEIPIEEKWIFWLTPDDVVDQSGQAITSIPEDIELFDEVPLEERWLFWVTPDDVEDPSGQTITSTPDDIELFDEVPIEETWTRWPPPDDVEDPSGQTTSSIPDDIELFGEVPLELTWIDFPRADEAPEDQSGQTISSVPDDMEFYEELTAETIYTVTFPIVPPNRGDAVNVVIVAADVVKGGAPVPVVDFTVTVFDGFSFADANFTPTCIIFKWTPVLAYTPHAAPILTKRIGTVGLYDGSFTPDVMAAATPPELYLITADVTVGLDARRWGEAIMAIAPCS